MPDLNDRAAGNWRPLLAIAELAGGTWPRRRGGLLAYFRTRSRMARSALNSCGTSGPLSGTPTSSALPTSWPSSPPTRSAPSLTVHPPGLPDGKATAASISRIVGRLLSRLKHPFAAISSVSTRPNVLMPMTWAQLAFGSGQVVARPCGFGRLDGLAENGQCDPRDRRRLAYTWTALPIRGDGFS